MVVIALRGYLREFGPKTIHFWLLFLSLNARTDPLSLPLLKLSSAHSPSPSIQSNPPNFVGIIMLHVRGLG